MTTDTFRSISTSLDGDFEERRRRLDAAWQRWRDAEDVYYHHPLRKYVSGGIVATTVGSSSTLLNSSSLAELDAAREAARIAQKAYEAAFSRMVDLTRP